MCCEGDSLLKTELANQLIPKPEVAINKLFLRPVIHFNVAMDPLFFFFFLHESGEVQIWRLNPIINGKNARHV